MQQQLIQGFKEKKDASGRIVQCGLCPSKERDTIVTHMKSRHPDEWAEWVQEFRKLRSNGASFKQIMWQFNRLFSWTVIKRELLLSDPLLKKEVKIRNFFPLDFKLEETTLWRFPSSGRWATHSGIYPGNWAPQVPRNLILRYSKVGQVVCDPFVGGGTTLIECAILGRHAIGVDVNPVAINICKGRLANLRKEARKQDYALPKVKIEAVPSDARKLTFIKDSSIDLICTHPPYMNAIRYTKFRGDDLSAIPDMPFYLDQMKLVAKQCHRILGKDGKCCVMIGDVKSKGKLMPLGLELSRTFEETKFGIEEIIIKEQERTSSSEFWQDEARRNHDLSRKHEYIFVFQKE
ncbi:MAG: TRM11 family SAM-dependent methyltransferase [Nitrososphaerales archaeon]